MLLCALCIVPIVFAASVASLWVAVVLVGVAAAAHQGWSANLFTTASDMFPKNAVGSIVGLGGMAGAVGGMLLATSAGYLLEWTGSYMPLFIISGSVYLVALVYRRPARSAPRARGDHLGVNNGVRTDGSEHL